MPLSPGENIGRYTVEAVLGEGAMAQVFAVKHDTLDTRHALKILMGGSPIVQERLIREGKVQASLRHPNAVAVTDVFDIDGAPVLLMELIEGPDLEEWLEDHKPTLTESLAVFGGILAGMRSAHSKDIIHRDLKPANVLLHIQDGELVPKVSDFGLAKALDPGGMKKTQAGVTMGTPAYMAPEQIRDASTADARADIFALGCILYELITGQQCFDGPDIFSIFSKIATAEYTPPQDLVDDLPPEVLAAIEGALKTERDERFEDCDALAEALYGSRSGFPTTLPLEGAGGDVASAIWKKKEDEIRRKSDAAQAEIARRSAAEAEAEVLVAETLAAPGSESLAVEAPPMSLAPSTGLNKGTSAAMIAGVLFIFVIVVGAAVGTAVMIVGNKGAVVTPPEAVVATAAEGADASEPGVPEGGVPEEVPEAAAPVDEPGVGDEPQDAEQPEKAPVEVAAPPKEKPAPKETVPPKVVEPVVAEAPPPEPPPAEVVAAAPAGGSFSVSGNASYVLLTADGRKFSEGQTVPAGTYTITARFGEEEVPAGTVSMAVGQQVQIDCVAVMRRCVLR